MICLLPLCRMSQVGRVSPSLSYTQGQRENAVPLCEGTREWRFLSPACGYAPPPFSAVLVNDKVWGFLFCFSIYESLVFFPPVKSSHLCLTKNVSKAGVWDFNWYAEEGTLYTSVSFLLMPSDYCLWWQHLTVIHLLSHSSESWPWAWPEQEAAADADGKAGFVLTLWPRFLRQS